MKKTIITIPIAGRLSTSKIALKFNIERDFPSDFSFKLSGRTNQVIRKAIKEKAAPAGTVERALQSALTNRFYLLIRYDMEILFKLFCIFAVIQAYI